MMTLYDFAASIGAGREEPAAAELPTNTVQDEEVRERLSGVDGIHSLSLTNFDIFVMRDFLRSAECQEMIDLIDAEKEPSRLLLQSPDRDFRTSETSYLRRGNALVSTVEARIDGLLGIPACNGEPIQGQRYSKGQQFKPHHDFFHEDQIYWPEQQRTGGQRTWTAMVLLNAPSSGGETFFPKIGLRITPRAGNLIIWRNLDAQGKPNPLSLHQGMPVKAGLKYILTKWYRQRAWLGARPLVQPS